MNRGTILHVCVAKDKGIAKDAVPSAVLQKEHGLQGDAHAGPWHRQVSLLSETDIETMRARGLDLKPGAFGENLVVGGLNLDALGIGTRLRVGEAELEITQIGKVCHTRCAIYYHAGDCIMPRAGLFARVLESGPVTPDMPIEVISEIPRRVVQAAVVTVSDRCAAGKAEDTAGPAVGELLTEKLDAHVSWTGLVPDDMDTISATIKEIAERNIDLLLTVGGTGLGPRDVTPEATLAVLERRHAGLMELVRLRCYDKTPFAYLSRGETGTIGRTLVINLPGSQRGAVECLTALLDVLPHAIELLRGEARNHDRAEPTG
jgi:molybdenum cofactor synthesis domain-containing protein